MLCLKFQLQKTSLLLGQEEFDEAEMVTHTVYQKLVLSNRWLFYKVGPGSYMIVGGVSSFDMSQASTKTPESYVSLGQEIVGVLWQMLAPVKESEPLELLSFDKDKDCIPLSSLNEFNNLAPSHSRHVRTYGVASSRSMESPCSSVGVVD